VEVNCGWGDTMVVNIMSISPMRYGHFNGARLRQR